MYTMIKFMIQLEAVDIELPTWRALSGKISDGYTHTVAWKPIVKAPWKMKSIAAAAMPDVSGVKCEHPDVNSPERNGYAYGQCLSCAVLGR